jgi:hypothetical protein
MRRRDNLQPLFVAAAIFFCATALAEADTSLGESIYLSGIGSDRLAVKATVQNDIRVDGTQFTCAGCHQRSGFGSSEGGLLIPAITGNILFSADENTQPELHEAIVRRPAYDAQSLRRAIVGGVGANDKSLDLVMPRYELNDEEFRSLHKYLKGLSTSADAGIDKDTIHLAIILSEDSDPDEVDAILRIANRYFFEKNSGTRLESKRAKNSPWHKDWHYSAYRRWKLHEWRLTGPENTWSEQLTTLYKQQAIFAVFGGLASGDWTPIHDFCQNNRIPCLLPNITAAPTTSDSHFSIYFAKGLSGEGEVVGKWIRSGDSLKTVVQLHDGSDGALSAVRSTQRALGDFVEVVSIDVGSADAKQRFDSVLAKSGDAAVVAWLNQEHGWWTDLRQHKSIRRLIVSSTLIHDFNVVLSTSGNFSVHSVHEYHIGATTRHNRRLRAWARSRKIELDHLRLQANTYYALAIIGDALQHIRGHFSREYFLEKIEHMSQRILVSSAYAKLSIAPKQRVMSKGSYIIPVLPDGRLDSTAAEWIVP